MSINTTQDEANTVFWSEGKLLKRRGIRAVPTYTYIYVKKDKASPPPLDARGNALIIEQISTFQCLIRSQRSHPLQTRKSRCIETGKERASHSHAGLGRGSTLVT